MIVKYILFMKNSSGTRMSELVFNGGLVYKFKRIDGNPNISDQIKTNIKRYKKSEIQHGYRATVCMLLVNPIMA